MKHLRFLPILLALILSSCVKSQFEVASEASEGIGLLKIGLSVDDGLQIVQAKSTSMDAALVPEVDSLYVELYRLGMRPNAKKETWNRIYFGKYEQAKDTVLRVNGGSWKMLAFHGDSTACGFDKPYFKAEEFFTVDGGVDAQGNPNMTTVNAIAKVENVRISVNFDETVSGSFYDYFIRFTNLDQIKKKQILRYRKDQTKDAYMMPSDSLQIEFMAQYEYGNEDSWRFAVLDTLVTKGNDHLTINLSVNPRTGGLDININTDENIVKETVDLEILEMWAPQNPPQIVAAGFVDGDHAVVEGDNLGNNATVSVLARGGLKNFYLTLESDYLSTIGIDVPLNKELDLANPTPSTQADLDKLAAAGFDWQDDMAGSRRLTYLTMTKLFEEINGHNTSLSVARNLVTFKIRVVDEVNNETALTLTSTALPITQTLSVSDGNIWATKIVSPQLHVERGVSSLYTLQISTDGSTWNDLKKFEKVSNNILDFGVIPTTPSTQYKFRTIYNNNPQLVSNVVTVNTEDALQLGNAGFEDFQTVVLNVSAWGTKYDRKWYLPYAVNEADPWWAVNSRKTMPTSHSSLHHPFKCFPTAGYSDDRYEGGKSAMIFTVNVNGLNTDGTSFGDKVPGEIWIGKADDSGNHASDGHAFASRPLSVKFWYKYMPLNTETFVVSLIVRDAAGNEIAKVEKTDGQVSTEWKQIELPIVYSNTTTKAASIYMSFKSCVSGEISMNKSINLSGVNESAHIGSILRVDNIELTY